MTENQDERWLKELFSESPGVIADDGFTEGVMARLPHRRSARGRRLILGIAAAFSALGGLYVFGGSGVAASLGEFLGLLTLLPITPESALGGFAAMGPRMIIANAVMLIGLVVAAAIPAWSD